MKTKKILNAEVMVYLASKDESKMQSIYYELLTKYERQLDGWVKTTNWFNPHEAREIFDDTLMNTLKIIKRDGGDFDRLFHRSLYNRYKSLTRKIRVRKEHEVYESANYDDDEAATPSSEIADDFNLEETVITKKEADQRKLIDSFLSNADATTTAIVQAFLQHPKPTPTAIGKVLGLHHSVVIRKLEKLGSTFDYKQHGDYRDYLLAI